MGFRVHLIAVTGKEPRIVQRQYGVIPTARRQEIPEAPIVGATLPAGVYLLYVNDRNKITPDEKVYARLSKGASLVACYANETDMRCYACGWVDGVERWSLFHDAQQGLKHLESSGTLPPEFEPIRDRLFERQQSDDSVDFLFDVPVELFVALGGIRHDHDIPDADPKPWEILDPVK